MSKNTSLRPSITKKPGDISISSDNNSSLRGTYTPQNSAGTKVSLRPNSTKADSKPLNKKSSQLSISSQTKDNSSDKGGLQPDGTKSGFSQKGVTSSSKADLDKPELLQLDAIAERGSEMHSTSRQNIDSRRDTTPRVDQGENKTPGSLSLKDREEEKDDNGGHSENNNKPSSKQTHHKNNSSQSSLPRTHNKVDSATSDDLKFQKDMTSEQIPPNRNSEGSNTVGNIAAALIGVQKAKINLLEKAASMRGRSNSTQMREKETSPVQKQTGERSLSRKASIVSNQSSNELALKKEASNNSQPAPNANDKVSGKPNTNINIFNQSNINVNNYNNMFLTGGKSASDKPLEKKKTGGLGGPSGSSTANSFLKPTGLSASTDSSGFLNIKNLTALAGLSLLPKAEPSGNNKVSSSNIRVIARFRPLNSMEQDLIQSGLGSECAAFPDERSAIVLPDTQTIYTLDRVFSTKTEQHEVYEFVGKEMIDDVLQGYNGTIFAYGQTSSGKTFTMFGDIHNDEMRGIIPRATRHVFDHIAELDYDTEFVIKCSMLEIYKETLYDLLNERNNDLKIKEDPRKGIYIDGLNQESVADEEELMEVLEIGSKSKMMAATRMNQHSSRSHTLFIMEIIQKLPNQSEKRGILNLVDLAGSEKVGKTGAQGETLEEAKKINLSLSCLGNVIHSLTINADHIPYRDSKLTRILQESLGGNYKTSLVVTCSPHSSNKEETISTLKFATRAKTIKTHYKMNVQNSPESMLIMIESLKIQLDECRTELGKYKNGEIPMELGRAGGDPAAANRFSRFRPARVRDEQEEPSPKYEWNLAADLYTPSLGEFSRKQDQILQKKNTVQDMGELGNYKHIVSNNLELNKEFADGTIGDALTLANIDDRFYDKKGKKNYNTFNYFKTNLELINQNETLELRVSSLKSEIARLHGIIDEKDNRIKRQDDDIMGLKNSLLALESKHNQLYEEKQMNELRVDKNTESTEHLKLTAQVLEKQVLAITEALLNCEQSIEGLLRDKANLINTKFQDVMKDNLEFKQLKLSEYFQNSYNFNYEPFYNTINTGRKSHTEESHDDKPLDPTDFIRNPLFKESFISQLDLQNAFSNASNKLTGIVDVPYKVNSILNQGNYGNIIRDGVIDDKISSELTGYLMKQQLIQCMIINKHLERVIAALEWKQIIEYGKAKIKSNYTRMLEKQIQNMEQVLENAAISHQQLRNRVEAVEMDGIRLREAFLSQDNKKNTSHLHDSHHKARVVRPVKREGTQRRLTKKLGDATSTNKEKPGESTFRERLKTEEEEVHPNDLIGKRLSFAKNVDSPRVSIDPANNLLKEIDKELGVTNGNPNSLDEAKLMLNLKNQIIDKLQKYVVSSTSSFQVQSPFAGYGGERDTGFGQNEVDYFKSENERLENKVLILQTELDLEKSRSEQLKEAYEEGKKQISKYKKLCEELEVANRNALKAENENWQRIFDELKTTQEKEIIRKQEEVKKLHDLLAGWIFKYMELQESKAVTPSHQEKMLFETFKRKEIPDKSLLEKALIGAKNTQSTSSVHNVKVMTPQERKSLENRKHF